jgi:hypothetical protein
MTLAQLIASFRIDADDSVAAYLWSDAAITDWLNEAQAEAAIRARLLHESSNALVCQIAVSALTSTYPLHASLYEISHIAFKETGQAVRTPVKLVSTEEMDAIRTDWRDASAPVQYAIQSDTSIRIAPAPDAAGTLLLEGYRLPAVMTTGANSPEINAAHHRHLVHWALHRAFSKPDAETIDPTRAALADAAFARYFGIRPSADLRRSTRQDEVHHTKAFWG